jgi:NAD(P)-dependent dehydrogenase (short-subunit alcohol dehydrogenase family)
MILMRTLAVVLGKEGIRVNSVMPGTIQTGIYEHRLDQATAAAGAARRNPLRRIGRPHEVADAIHWLASEEAAFVNGAELLVDGGQTQLRY